MLSEGEPIRLFDPLRVYEDIFVKVKTWSTFELSDIAGNRIAYAEFVPSFVKIFEQKLDRIPRLRSSVRYFLYLSLCGSILTGPYRCI